AGRDVDVQLIAADQAAAKAAGDNPGGRAMRLRRKQSQGARALQARDSAAPGDEADGGAAVTGNSGLNVGAIRANVRGAGQAQARPCWRRIQGGGEHWS